jgi:hypothetical protein
VYAELSDYLRRGGSDAGQHHKISGRVLGTTTQYETDFWNNILYPTSHQPFEHTSYKVTLAMFNDITKPPPPLPTTELFELEDGLSLMPPLSRRAHGPGLIVLIPDTSQQLAIIDGVPSQPIKWAEEGYTLVAIQRRALITGAKDALTKAAESLARCEKCAPNGKIGLLGKS